MLMLKRTDWRSLQWTESDASEPIQLTFDFYLSREEKYASISIATTTKQRMTKPT